MNHRLLSRPEVPKTEAPFREQVQSGVLPAIRAEFCGDARANCAANIAQRLAPITLATEAACATSDGIARRCRHRWCRIPGEPPLALRRYAGRRSQRGGEI